MKFTLVLSLVLIFSINLYSQVSINGYMRTDNRFRMQQDGKLSWNDNSLGLKFSGSPSDNIYYYSEVRLRGFGFSDVHSTADLQRRQKDFVQTWGLEFREAYIDIYGFLTEDLDVRIGRQRIVWGTADRLNPTDNLNPDDLEDIFDFGRHLGSNALMATYYLNDITFSGVVIPVFTPAVLPFGDWLRAFTPQVTLPPGTQIGTFEDEIILPENKLSETSSFGLKASTNLFNYDVSLSYYYGRDDLPLTSKVTLTPADTLGTLNAQAEMIYPRIQVVGADLAGSIGDVGVWAEGALFFPDKYYMDVTFPDPQYGMVTQQELVLDDKPYFKFVIGSDYTFKNGWYINGQYLHGFIHERGSENLIDYFLMRVEKKFMNDAIKIVPFGFALAIPDWKDIENNYGIAGGPEIDYYPIDALEIALGAYLIAGKGNNLFSNVNDLDEFYFKVTYDF